LEIGDWHSRRGTAAHKSKRKRGAFFASDIVSVGYPPPLTKQNTAIESLVLIPTNSSSGCNVKPGQTAVNFVHSGAKLSGERNWLQKSASLAFEIRPKALSANYERTRDHPGARHV
jgi:hypothetical protein